MLISFKVVFGTFFAILFPSIEIKLNMIMSQNRSAPSSLFLVRKEGLGALSYGAPILRHSHMELWLHYG